MSDRDTESAARASAAVGGAARHAESGPRQAFRPFDAACLIVGIIVGAGLYETAPNIASSVDTPFKLMLLAMLFALLTRVS